MSSPADSSAAKYAGAARRIDAVQRELVRLNRWRQEPATPEMMRFTQAFGADTMSLEQWLQFVFIPRVREIIAAGGDFPASSQVGTYALRNFDGDDEAADLVRMLCEFDRFITGDGTDDAPPPDDTPVPNAGPTDPYAKALAEYREGEFLREVEKINEALGREVQFDVDWSSAPAGCTTPEERMKALRNFMYRGVSDIRAAMCLLESNYGEEAARGVAGALTRIKLRNLAEGESTCRFLAGVLDIQACFRKDAVRDLEIGRVMVDALDLRTKPKIEKLRNETIPEHEKRLADVFECPISVEIDFDSFAAEPDGDLRVEALENVAREGVYHLCYTLESLARDEAVRSIIRARVAALRLRHVVDPTQRELTAEGGTIILAGRFCRVPDEYWKERGVSPYSAPSAYLYQNEIEQHLPGVLAGLPAPVLSPAGKSAEQLLAECRKIAATCQGRISTALGAPVNLDVDWAAVSGDVEALARLPGRALQRVTGAVLLSEPALKASMSPAKPQTIRIRFVADPAARSCRLDGGVLDVAVCVRQTAGAPAKEAGFFYEGELAKVISDSLGLETTPLIGSLQDETIPDFARWMNENLESNIEVIVEWDGFLTHDDVGKNKWALQRLRQDGLENLYYALRALNEKSEDFARMIRRRVKTIRVQHVGKPAQKALLGQGNELVFRVHLHEGYDGRLTIDEMRRMLPALLADMTDAPEPAPPPEPDEPNRDEDSDDSAEPAPPEPEPRIMLLQGMVDAGIHHLESRMVQPFLMMFMSPELLTALWQDGGSAFQKLLADFEPRRELFLWAFRKCKTMEPELSDDGSATFRFTDLPPGVTIEPLVFRESEGRWLLDIFRVTETG